MVSDTLPPPPACDSETVMLKVYEGSGTSGRSGQDAGERHSEEGQEPKVWILQLAVPCPESIRRIASDDRLVVFRNYVTLTNFKMQMVSSVLGFIWKGDIIVSTDLKDAYFQILIHPDS